MRIRFAISKRLIGSSIEKALKLAEAIDEITGRASEQPELQLFLDSLRSSERGLIR